MDALVQYVLEEIAMDGELGTDVVRLKSFVDCYYNPNSAIPALSTHQPQNTDDTFFAFVWDTLVQQDDLSPAVLQRSGSTSEIPGVGDAADGEADQEGNEVGEDQAQASKSIVKGKGKEKQEPEPAKNTSRGKGKKAGAKPSGPVATHSLRTLKEDEVSLGLSVLREKYGDTLRVTVSPEASWAAITGSHARPTSISPTVYALLQLVSRSRGEGITVVEVGKTLGIDQRSAFHYVRAGVVIGALKKYRDHAHKGTWTNRLVHVRFLEICPSWHAHLATDDRALDNESENESRVKEEEDSAWSSTASATLPHSSLWSNAALVRRRVLRAIRMMRDKGQNYLLHQDIAPSIGLYGCERRELRKLNTIITAMADEKVIEKILLPYQGLNGLSRIHCIRLPEEKDEEDGEGEETADPIASTSTLEPVDEDETPRASATASIERQIFDLLAQADMEGLTNRDLRHALGGYNSRTIESLFTRYIRDKPPAHLSDYTVHALFETVGRQKRLRYFLLPGYRRRCIRDGIADPSLEEGLDIVPAVPIGGFARLERGFYKDADDLEEILSETPVKSTYGKQTPHAAAASAGPSAKGKQRKAQKPRARKVPGAPLTYYEKRKIEDAERAAQGLPPREKRPASKGGRRPKGWIKPESEAPTTQLGSEVGADVDMLEDDTPIGTPVPATKKKAPAKPRASRSKKAATVSEPSTGASTPTVATPGPASSALFPSTEALLAGVISSLSAPIPSPQPVASTSAAAPIIGPFTMPSTADARPNKRRHNFTVDVSPKRRPQEELPAAPVAPEAQVAPAQAHPLPSEVSSPQPQEHAIPASSAPPQSSPEPESKTKQARGMRRQGEFVRRARVMGKANLTGFQRETDVLSFLAETGGICTNSANLAREINAWHKESGVARVFSDDKATRDQTMASLVKRNAIVKHTVIARRKVDLYCLPHITLDSPEMVVYQAHLFDPDYGGWKNSVAKPHSERPIQPHRLEDPSPEDTREVIQAFFRNESRIVGAKYGSLYGRFARARELHKFLVGVLHHENPTSPFVFSKSGPEGDEPNIVSDELMSLGMPLRVYLRILPVPELSKEFDTFLADASNLDILTRDLPPWVLQILSPSSVSRKRALNIVLRSLTELSLISPLIEQPGLPNSKSKTFTTPVRNRRQVSATHWRLLSEAPIYAVSGTTADKGKDTSGYLVAVAPLTTPAEVDYFWECLFDACLHPVATKADRPPVTSDRYPPVFQGSKAFASNLASTTKWQETYMLLEPQRTFLTKIAEDARFKVDDAAAEFLEATASDLMAPVDVITEYLRQVQAFKHSQTYRPLAKRQKLNTKRSKARSAARGSDDEHQEAEAKRITAQTRLMFARQTLRNKASEAEAQRQRDWSLLIERFRAQHDGFKIEPPVLEFLHKRFCTSVRSKQITMRDVERELKLLLPVSQDGETDVNYRSIIPSSVHQAVAMAADPYALPRAPVIRKRPRKYRKTKNAVAEAKPVFEHSGLANEFLSAAPRPLPTLGKGQRIPRNFFNDEQNELCLDMVAILKSRADHLGQRIAYAAMEQLFEGFPAPKLRQFFLRLVQKEEDRAYHERLKDAWSAVWNVKRGTDELPDPEPESMTDFDLAIFLRCLRANVNKQALRMAGPKPIEIATPVELPPLSELEAAPLVIEGDRSSMWSVYWRHGTTALVKEVDIAVIPFASACYVPKAVSNHDALMTVAALKMLLITPNANYTEPVGTAFIKPYEDYVEEATARLTASSIIVKFHSEGRRRLPGRNFVIGEKYLSLFDGSITGRKAYDAQRAEINLRGDEAEADDDTEELWPLVVEDGEMMALVRLVSDGLVDISIDTSVTLDLRDPEDYQTRQATDESIECTVQVGRARQEPQEPDGPLPRPSPAPSSLIKSDRDHIDQQLAVITTSIEDPLASQTFAAILSAGLDGVAWSTLLQRMPEVTPNTLLSHVTAFVAADSPILFWAGHSHPVLVASQFLSSWTVKLVSKGAESPRRCFPAIWLDITGDLVPVMWEKALRWVQEQLMSHAGISCPSVVATVTCVSKDFGESSVPEQQLTDSVIKSLGLKIPSKVASPVLPTTKTFAKSSHAAKTKATRSISTSTSTKATAAKYPLATIKADITKPDVKKNIKIPAGLGLSTFCKEFKSTCNSLASTIGGEGSVGVFRCKAVTSKNPYSDWGQTDLKKWLQDHHVPAPSNLNTEQLRDLVKQNYDGAYDKWSDSDIASWTSANSLYPTAKAADRPSILRSIRRSYDNKWAEWDDSDLREWLADHNIVTPKTSTHDELLSSVRDNWNTARSYVPSANGAQSHFEAAKDSAWDAWTESSLREFLLEKGIISPASHREELIHLAKKHGASASRNAEGAWAGATDSVSSGISQASKSATSVASVASSAAGSAASQASETLSSAWYAATDSPALAYDYVSDKAQGASDYIWSTWTDTELFDYAAKKGWTTPDKKSTREELLPKVKESYDSISKNAYDTWSDSKIKSWLNNHGVGKAKTASTREDLLDLMSRSYYGAKDTTYNAWSDAEVRRWLESRGLVNPGASSDSKTLRDTIADNYYSLRDHTWQAWDDSLLKHYLQKAGVVEAPATRSGLIQSIKDTYYGVDDSVWDSWSDAKMRAWLVKENVVDKAKAADYKRHELENLLRANWAKAGDNVSAGWTESDMRAWLVKNGFVKSDAQLKKDEILSSFNTNYGKVANKSSAYLTWSDARIRGWLREHGIAVPMKTSRQELTQSMRENYISTQSGLYGAVDNIKDWISGTVGVVEGGLGDAVDLLKGAVGAGAIFGEEARLKAKYASAQADSLYGSADDTEGYLSGASRSATSLASQASKSGYSAASVASASGSSIAGEAASALSSGALQLSSSASSVWSVASASYSSAYDVASKSAVSASYHASKTAAASLSSAGLTPSQIYKSAASAGDVAASSASSAASVASKGMTEYLATASRSATSLASSASASLLSAYSVAQNSASSASSVASASAVSALSKQGLAPSQISKSASLAGDSAYASATSVLTKASQEYDRYTVSASSSASSASSVMSQSLSSQYSALSKSAVSASFFASRSASSALSSAGYDPSAISKSAASSGSVAAKSASSLSASADSAISAYATLASRAAESGVSSISSAYSVASKSAVSGASEASRIAYASATKAGYNDKSASQTASLVSKSASSALSVASKSLSSAYHEATKSASSVIAHNEL
ncbi:hypothetical protein P7C70_g2212, partial [Phenoliferia sp. Uapishka_3]